MNTQIPAPQSAAPHREIEFIAPRRLFFLVSGALVLASIVMLVSGRLKLGIDFTGGTVVQMGFKQNVDTAQLRAALAGRFPGVDVQSVAAQGPYIREYIVRVNDSAEKSQTEKRVSEAVAAQGIPFEVMRVEYVGPTIGRHLQNRAFQAIGFSLLGIIVYVAFRFKSSVWGVAGVVALAHDVLLTLGFLMLMNREITLVVIAALLTLVGYSINDSIVVFDRIRENMRLNRTDPLDRVMNRSLNQTLTRTILTSATTLVAVGMLYVLGNEVIKDFALTMLFGCIVGTYSSIYVASAMVLEYRTLGKARA